MKQNQILERIRILLWDTNPDNPCYSCLKEAYNLIADQQAKIEELEKENLAELDKEYCNGFRAGHNHGLDEALAMRVGDLGGRRTIHKLPPDVATILATRMLTPPEELLK